MVQVFQMVRVVRVVRVVKVVQVVSLDDTYSENIWFTIYMVETNRILR